MSPESALMNSCAGRLLALLCLLALPLAAQAAEPPEERVLIVKDYRYLPGVPAGDEQTGQSLCGSRCNALSFDYLNVLEPGGWRMIKVAADRELTVDLENPFMKGSCICIADEYIVKIDELNRPQRSGH